MKKIEEKSNGNPVSVDDGIIKDHGRKDEVQLSEYNKPNKITMVQEKKEAPIPEELNYWTIFLATTAHTIAAYGFLTFPYFVHYKTVLWCKLHFFRIFDLSIFDL